jgi:hypothetical protein
MDWIFTTQNAQLSAPENSDASDIKNKEQREGELD